MKKHHKFCRGALLIEVVIAVALFALGMMTMAMMYYAFLSGSRLGTFRPHADRLQMEILSRSLEQDFVTYRPAFVFEGEVDLNSSWLVPGPLTLYNGATPYILKPYGLNQNSFLTDTGLTLVANTATRKAYTLIFIGPEVYLNNSNRWVVYAEVVYQLEVLEDSGNRIIYKADRIQRDNGSGNNLKGFTHSISFSADGFTLSNPDQSQPEFVLEPSTNVNDLIRVLLPNGFSKRVKNTVTMTDSYFYPLILKYHLTQTGL